MDKVKWPRYRAGKAPAWAGSAPGDDEEEVDDASALGKQPAAASLPHKEDLAGTVVLDRRQQRVSQAAAAADPEETRGRHRVAEVVAPAPAVLAERRKPEREPSPEPMDKAPTTTARKGNEGANDADENESRRARILRQMQREREEAEAAEVVEEVNEDEGESEYEEEEEDDDGPLIAKLPPPVFMRKEDRDTIREREKTEAEEKRLEAEREAKAQERADESRNLMVEELKREALEQVAAQSEGEPEEDDLNDEEAYEQWKVRELRRIKREKEELEKMKAEQEDVARRRKLTDDEVAKLDADRLALKEKPKWNYLQKYAWLCPCVGTDIVFFRRYWHKGAYYADDDLLKRDYSAPTEADRVDKSVLPSVLQVKNFGKAGRVKWTHLTAEDTTKHDAGWTDKETFNPKVWYFRL
jgi:microfibrillar-associated protein 1